MFDFSGRANLKDFWYFVLFQTVTGMLFGFFKGSLKLPEGATLFFLIIMVLPYFALGFRRLNDAGVPKWLFLIPFVHYLLAGLPSKSEE